jgi:hypothetical protein
MKAQAALALMLLTLAPIEAVAQSQDDQQACMSDAFNVCGQAIPDRDRVAACLAQNINRISLACRTVMLRYNNKPVPTRERITTVRNDRALNPRP